MRTRPGAPEDPAGALLRAAGEVLGTAVVGAERLAGGYTAQRVHRLRLADGRTCVLKSAPPAGVDSRLAWPAELEREIRLYDVLPELTRWRPEHRGDFWLDGWRCLLMEDVGSGASPPPWTPAAVDAVAGGLAALHGGAGRGRIHGDVRSDNLFLVPGRGLVLVDWAESEPGAGLLDAVYWAVGVELEGFGSAAAALEAYLRHAGGAQPGAVAAALQELRGLTAERLGRPREPAPVRELRRREAAVLDRWLVSCTG